MTRAVEGFVAPFAISIAVSASPDSAPGLNRTGAHKPTGPERTTIWYAGTHMVSGVSVSGVSSDLLEGLRDDLGLRRIGSGMARLDEYWAAQRAISTRAIPTAAALLCYVAQWVDAGWRDVDVGPGRPRRVPQGRSRALARCSITPTS